DLESEDPSFFVVEIKYAHEVVPTSRDRSCTQRHPPSFEPEPRVVELDTETQNAAGAGEFQEDSLVPAVVKRKGDECGRSHDLAHRDRKDRSDLDWTLGVDTREITVRQQRGIVLEHLAEDRGERLSVVLSTQVADVDGRGIAHEIQRRHAL